MSRYTPTYLPGLAPNNGELINVEKHLRTQVDKLRELGLITAAHEGTVALALLAARNVDTMGQAGAPSGRANLLKATADVFAMLPTADDVESDAAADIIAAITGTDAA